MEKRVILNGREMTARATGLLPKQYRFHFGRDLFGDMFKLDAAMKKAKEGGSFKNIDLEIFENIAWLMFRAGGEDVGNNPDEWLDSLDMLSIYEVLPSLLQLWGKNLETTSKAKKKIK